MIIDWLSDTAQVDLPKVYNMLTLYIEILLFVCRLDRSLD
ncbi:Uncharacterised protein [Staphylococcus aureus]|nr:hypothetical protein SaO408_2155 [Staphylococcus aureus]CAC6824097.1 Uncharacterised protein [Staphylococcus aureus]CAC8149183.1 Uncharacterised protein [Staphylococcus aureus]CAG9973438.1 hypothetical protein SA3102_SA3102_00045 [Staphylococcus aureus]CAH0011187.1 hypothetical protein SA3056_SA3056_01672 [Staphylococcus aureus]